MEYTAAHLLLDTLSAWGVEVIFGLPGDGINGIMAALRERQDKIRFVQVRHEEAAALMACAYAKWTGRLGVCLSTSGPGAIHLLNGLYDAKMDGMPVLAITGMPFHDLIGTFTQQDVPVDRLFADVALYNERIMGPTHVENVVDLACRTAIGRHTVAHVAFPISFQSMPAESQKPSPRNLPHHESSVPGRGYRAPDPQSLQQAADVLNAGKKTFILAGRGALGAGAELLQIAERLGAPIGKALLGKCVVPDDSEYTTGSIGYLGTDASQAALDACDTMLMVGSSFPYLEYLPKPGKAKVVQIDTDPMRIGIRCPVEVGLVSDAATTLQALLPLLNRREDRSFLGETQANKRTWDATLRERATKPDKPMKPQVVAYELGKRLTDNAVFSGDSGTSALWWARYIPARGEQMQSVSGLLATMACGLPYINAAQIAYPDRQCVALVGDGALSMLMGEFITSVKYKLPVKIVVLNNQSFGYIRWEQILMQGSPEFGVEIQDIDYAAFARACGGTGFRVDDPAQIGSVLDQAFATPGPVIVDAIVDPYEPATPPKVSAEQKQNFHTALANGQPHREEIEHSTLAERVSSSGE